MKLNTSIRKRFRVSNKVKRVASNDRFRLSISRSAKNISAQIIDDIKMATEAVEGVDDCMVVTTFDPPFGPEMMSEEARMILNI